MITTCRNQFEKRAHDAERCGFIDKDSDIAKVGRKIQTAEFFQLLFYGSLAAVYILTTTGHIQARVAGIVTLAALPLEIIAYYETMALYGKTSKVVLTIMAAISLAAMATMAIMGLSGDYSWTMCGGGFLVHTARIISEYNDYNRKKEESVCQYCHR